MLGNWNLIKNNQYLYLLVLVLICAFLMSTGFKEWYDEAKNLDINGLAYTRYSHHYHQTDGNV